MFLIFKQLALYLLITFQQNNNNNFSYSQNVMIFVSMSHGGHPHQSVMLRKPQVIEVGALDMWDKADIVRSTLAQSRKQLQETGFNNQVCK
jgi:hypothetical protein